MELNFNQLKKSTMKVTLADKDNTVINIKVPTKYIFDEFKNSKETPDDYYHLANIILNHNIEHKEFTEEEINKIFDYSDTIRLIDAYSVFIQEIVNQKN